MSLDFQNTGEQDLEYKITKSPKWIKQIQPSSGVLKASQKKTLTIEIDRNSIIPGSNVSENIVLTSNAGIKTIRVTASVPGVYWYKTIGEGTIRSLVQTSDGGYALGVLRKGYNKEKTKYYHSVLWKVDASGNKQWSKKYGYDPFDLGIPWSFPNALMQTSDGGYALVTTESIFHHRIILFKTDALGNEQWKGVYEKYGNDAHPKVLRSIEQTSDGGYVIFGDTQTENDDSNLFLLKTDGSGNQQWEKTFGGSGDEHACYLSHSSGGYFLLASIGKYSTWQITTDALGNKQSEKINENSICGGSSSLALSDGSDVEVKLRNSKLWLIKRLSGKLQWERKFEGVQVSYTTTTLFVRQTSDGGYIVAGSTGNEELGSPNSHEKF